MVAMAGTTGDVIQLTVTTNTLGNVALNVYYYKIEDTPTDTYLQGLVNEFMETVLTPFAATQTGNTTIVSIYAKNIFSGDEYTDSTPTPAAGTRTHSGDGCASFIACAIKLIRENARVRHGRKMIFVPLESDIVGNLFAGSFVTLATTYANSLDDSLDAGGIDLFVPVIVGRVPYTTSEGKEAYRLPVSQAEMADNWSEVGGALVINRVTSMNSRKFWRGM